SQSIGQQSALRMQQPRYSPQQAQQYSPQQQQLYSPQLYDLQQQQQLLSAWQQQQQLYALQLLQQRAVALQQLGAQGGYSATGQSNAAQQIDALQIQLDAIR